MTSAQPPIAILAFHCAALVACLGASQASASEVASFSSAKYNYSVVYPREWRLVGSKDKFSIVNFPASKTLHGAVVPPGGAAIAISVPDSLLKDRDEMPQSLEEWIRMGTRHHQAVSRSTVRRQSGRPASEVIEVRTRCCVASPFFEITTWYFEMNGRFFRIAVQYWEGEQRANEFRRVFERVAESLRASQ